MSLLLYVPIIYLYIFWHFLDSIAKQSNTCTVFYGQLQLDTGKVRSVMALGYNVWNIVLGKLCRISLISGNRANSPGKSWNWIAPELVRITGLLELNTVSQSNQAEEWSQTRPQGQFDTRASLASAPFSSGVQLTHGTHKQVSLARWNTLKQFLCHSTIHTSRGIPWSTPHRSFHFQGLYAIACTQIWSARPH